MDKRNKILTASEAILKSMPQFAYVFNAQNKLVMWNKNLENVLGYTSEELYGKDIYDFTEAKEKDDNTEAISRIFDEKIEQSLEQNILTKDGRKIPVIDTANYASINGEEYLIGMAIDISKLRETQKKLEAQIIKTNQLKELLKTDNISLRKEIESAHKFRDTIGESKNILKTLYQIKQVAKTGTPVLLQGEIGNRKEHYARILHKQSNRKDLPFIHINCGSFKGDNVEKDFYSFLKEIFVEVEKSETGRFVTINKATLFFEEIHLLPLYFQPKLLRSLKNQRFELNGKPGVIYLDVRIIASVSQNMETLFKKNLINNDLFFFLNIFPISIPPLRERRSDIPLLVENFISRLNKKYGKMISKVSKKSMDLLQDYSWPGNLKEMENVIERAVILSNSSLLNIESFIPKEKKQSQKLLTLNDFEKEYIIRILNMTLWRIAGKEGAAKILGLHPETLRSKMRKLKIFKQDYIKYNDFH